MVGRDAAAGSGPRCCGQDTARPGQGMKLIIIHAKDLTSAQDESGRAKGKRESERATGRARERGRQGGLSGNYYTQRVRPSRGRCLCLRIFAFSLLFLHPSLYSLALVLLSLPLSGQWQERGREREGEIGKDSERNSERDRERDDFAAGLICRFSVLSVLRATCRLPTTTT